MEHLYVAYPIDHAGTHPSTSRIRESLEMLRGLVAESRLTMYDPGAAWTVGAMAEVAPLVQEVNNKAIHHSDTILAFVPHGVRSWGVPAEVAMAVQRGMNIAILHDGAVSWAMPQGGNVHYVQVEQNNWVKAAVAGLDWLVEHRPPRMKNSSSNGRYPLKFAKVRPEVETQLPTRGYADDAGLDLYVSEDTLILPGAFMDIPSNLAVELPDWSWGFLVGRSSTLRKKGLLVNPGIIDAGYRGELYAGVQNMSMQPVLVKAGERLAQLILMSNATRKVRPVEADRLGVSARGVAGFGSTGV